MSLPHFPSLIVIDPFDYGNRTDACYKWRQEQDRIREWKKEHELLDAKLELELKETTASYLTLFKTNMENYTALDKLREDVTKRKKKLTEFFEWLESDNSLFEAMANFERKEYEEKKKSLLGSSETEKLSKRSFGARRRFRIEKESNK